MSATIRAFSFLIKPKSLFYELIEELYAHEDMSTDETVCHLIKMFGGLSIKVPSVQELKLYQYLLNNSDEYLAKVSHYKNPRMAAEIVVKKIKSDYLGPLDRVEMYQVALNFVSVALGLDLDEELDKHSKRTVKRQKEKEHVEKLTEQYYEEEQFAEHDVPETEEDI
jgi:hypothetical protein